jgi:hypothetical protein
MSSEEVDRLELRVESPDKGSKPQPTLSPNQRAWRRFGQNRPAVWSAWVLAALILIVIGWPAGLKISSLTGSAAFAQNYQPDKLSDDQFLPPTAKHWFGTDVHGRDLLSRVLYGAQISLLVGIVGTTVSLVIGVLWGAIAGYAGGRIDSLMMRFVDVLYSMPSIIFVIVLITTLEGALKHWLTAIGSPGLGKSARLLFLFVGLGAVSQHAGHCHRLHHTDSSRYHSLRILPELPWPGHSTADGQLGFAHRRRSRSDESHSNLLVADRLPRRVPGHHPARPELSGRWPARCLGCPGTELMIKKSDSFPSRLYPNSLSLVSAP